MTFASVGAWVLRVLWREKDNRYCIIITVLTIALFVSRQQTADLREALAAKPSVRIQEVIKRVVGPVRVVEKIIEKPGGERIVERVIVRDVVTTETERDKVVTPVAVRTPRWYIGAGYSPTIEPREAWAGRIGLTNGRVDVGYRYGRSDRSHGLEAAARF